MSCVNLCRQYKLPPEDVFIPSLVLMLPSWKKPKAMDIIMAILLIIVVVITIKSISYAIYSPKPIDKYTEFYILGPDGKAEGYPTDLTAGQQAQVIVGVVNHESGTVSYTIQVKDGDYVQSTILPVVLGDGQKWEQPAVFVFNAPHESTELQFLLFRQGDASPYRSLHLWVTVKAPPAVS
jgi:uncharacterized membrane protein